MDSTSPALVLALYLFLSGAAPDLSPPASASSFTSLAAERPDSMRTPGPVRYVGASRGRSGAVRFAVVRSGARLRIPLEWEAGSEPPDATYRWTRADGVEDDDAGLLGESRLRDGIRAPEGAGVWRLQVSSAGGSEVVEDLKVVVRTSSHEKHGDRLNGYHLGRWSRSAVGRGDRYAPPNGFIEVTEAGSSLRISEHLTLGMFLTKDQHDVWPKYLLLDPRLVDKLELVMQELVAMGVQADHMHVFSGFRTPQYNTRIGQSALSRHTYGDAADFWIDNQGTGRMNDLNGDGRVGIEDARLILRAVDRVERRHPELRGGAGVYHGQIGGSPFIHIDVRGRRVRW